VVQIIPAYIELARKEVHAVLAATQKELNQLLARKIKCKLLEAYVPSTKFTGTGSVNNQKAAVAISQLVHSPSTFEDESGRIVMAKK
jgi:hypothetical protein